ncbi:tRNA 2'-phosphotransferase [Sporothrix epigloea]|uniref:2'-phosphotransferase n=1 Tax=Sporothrix epigloea TaxID=1892477 RepID=A0ABP0DM87_9PEZI
MENSDKIDRSAPQSPGQLPGIEAQEIASRGSSGHRGGRRGGRRGGGGSDDVANRAVAVSRALSKLLRHQAAHAGIPLDPEGYAPLDRVLQWGPIRSLQVTLDEVRDIVRTNDKQRFAMKMATKGAAGGTTASLGSSDSADDTDPAAFLIRANQGHSIATLASDAGLLTPIDDPATAPPLVCHGTFLAFWQAIETCGGLSRMARNHVHCGCLEQDEGGLVDRAGRPIPGLRRDAQVLVFLDVRRALREEAAIKWWRAANGVVLTEGNKDGIVPTRFFRRVVLSKEGEKLLPKVGPGAPRDTFVLWEDGKKVADVPAETRAKARVPMGKQGLAKRANAVATGATPMRASHSPTECVPIKEAAAAAKEESGAENSLVRQ